MRRTSAWCCASLACAGGGRRGGNWHRVQRRDGSLTHTVCPACQPTLPGVQHPSLPSLPASAAQPRLQQSAHTCCEEHPLFTLGPSSSPPLSVCPQEATPRCLPYLLRGAYPCFILHHTSHPATTTTTRPHAPAARSAAPPAPRSAAAPGRGSRSVIQGEGDGNQSCDAAPSFRRLGGWVAGAHKATAVPPRLLTAHTSCCTTAHLGGLQVGEEPLLRHRLEVLIVEQ